jgi:drug/metabolite transporter (DMT)-like permease
MGELYSILAAATWALGVIIYKRLGESLSPLALNLLKNLIVLALMVPTVIWAHGWVRPDFSLHNLLLTLLSGALGIALADTLYFRALNELGAGRLGVMGNLFSPSVIFLAWLALGEHLSALQGAGFLLVLGGVMLAHGSVTVGADGQRTARATRRGLFFGFAAVFLNALGIVMIKPVLETEPFFQVALLRMFAALFVMLALLPFLRRQFRMPNWRVIPWKVLLPAAFVGQYLSMLMWLAGYKYISASVASILNETASIFILLFAAAFLGERLTLRKLLGVALTFGGVVVMLWA